MKKNILFILIMAVSIQSGFAQLNVKDTLLLAFSDSVFWGASSELNPDIYADYGQYGSTNLADDDPKTCWAEGKQNDGSGEFIWLSIPEKTEKIRIRNGYQKSLEIYQANNRPKHISITLYAGYEPAGYVTESHNGFFLSKSLDSTSVKLEDKMGYQEITLNNDWQKVKKLINKNDPFDQDRFILKLEIIDVYKGDKWNDACISDIEIIPVPVFELTKDEHGLLKRTQEKKDTLFYNPENIYQVIEVSSDLKWVIFIIMSSEFEGRSETIYKLYSTQKEAFIEIEDISQLYLFEEKDGKIYLVGSNNDFNDVSVCLDEL